MVDDRARLRPEGLRQTDGRRVRGERTRRAIVEAHTQMLREGQLKPTAAAIAERAGVSVRTLWLAFGDMEGLLDATTDYWLRADDELRGEIDLEASLDERIAAFCAERARRLENIAPAAQAAALGEPFSAALRASRLGHVQRVREDIDRVFRAEIETVGEARRRPLVDALMVASSWNSWSLLRDDAGRSVEDSTAVMRLHLAALLPPR